MNMEESLKKMRLKRKHIYNQKAIVGRSGKHYEEKCLENLRLTCR